MRRKHRELTPTKHKFMGLVFGRLTIGHVEALDRMGNVFISSEREGDDHEPGDFLATVTGYADHAKLRNRGDGHKSLPFWIRWVISEAMGQRRLILIIENYLSDKAVFDPPYFPDPKEKDQGIDKIKGVDHTIMMKTILCKNGVVGSFEDAENMAMSDALWVSEATQVLETGKSGISERVKKQRVADFFAKQKERGILG